MKEQEKSNQNEDAQNASVSCGSNYYATQSAWWNQRNQAMSNIASYVNYASPYNGR